MLCNAQIRVVGTLAGAKQWNLEGSDCHAEDGADVARPLARRRLMAYPSRYEDREQNGTSFSCPDYLLLTLHTASSPPIGSRKGYRAWRLEPGEHSHEGIGVRS